jgi:ABC-type phosphate transport system permease subunit
MAEKNPKPELSRRKRLTRELNAQFIETLSTLLTTAFGLVAAFAWNEVVKSTISKYIAPGSTIVSQLIYAVLVTLLAVLISFQLGKLAAIYKIDSDDESK